MFIKFLASKDIKHAASENLINLHKIPLGKVEVMYFYFNFVHFPFYFLGDRGKAFK